MENLFWPLLAFGLVLFFFFMYSLLDGFDLGLGMLVPLLRNPEEKNKVIGLIAPFWDGNEVWLIMGVGFFFAAFPSAFSLLVPTFYLPIMVVIIAYIVRAVSIEFSYHDEARVRSWHKLFGIASLVIPFAGLAAVGAVMQGLPLDGARTIQSAVIGHFFGFPLLFGFGGLALVLWHGVAYALSKEPLPTLTALVPRLWQVNLLVVVMLGLSWAHLVPGAAGKPVVAAGGLLGLIGLLLARLRLFAPGWAFGCSALTVAGLWLAVGGTLFPDVIPSSLNPEWSLSISAMAAPLSSLRPVTVLVLVLTPMILLYTRFVYRAFRKSK